MHAWTPLHGTKEYLNSSTWHIVERAAKKGPVPLQNVECQINITEMREKKRIER